jgi:hypothetical protein
VNAGTGLLTSRTTCLTDRAFQGNPDLASLDGDLFHQELAGIQQEKTKIGGVHKQVLPCQLPFVSHKVGKNPFRPGVDTASSSVPRNTFPSMDNKTCLPKNFLIVVFNNHVRGDSHTSLSFCFIHPGLAPSYSFFAVLPSGAAAAEHLVGCAFWGIVTGAHEVLESGSLTTWLWSFTICIQ